MQSILEQWQQSLGLVGFAAALAGAGFVTGALVGLFLGRRATPSAPAVIPDIPPPVSKEEVILDAPITPRDKRRNPRRPGRSVEIFVALPNETDNPVKGVVLNRSVGGLGILVGDAYPAGTAMCVLPVSASQLTPWVEVAVKTCRRNGDDWELGVQFQKLPPYSTMVQFG